MNQKTTERSFPTSIISKAKFELGLISRYGSRRRKKKNKPTYQCWAKVITFLGDKHVLDPELVKRIRLDRRFFHMRPNVRVPRISIINR